MLLTDEMVKGLNEQIGREYDNAGVYQVMAAAFERRGLPKLAKRFAQQADDERGHAKRFIDHLTDMNACAGWPAIPAPQECPESLVDAAQAALVRELNTTANISNLVKQARTENDLLTEIALQWFVLEQIEEMRSAQDLVDLVETAKGDPNLVELRL